MGAVDPFPTLDTWVGTTPISTASTGAGVELLEDGNFGEATVPLAEVARHDPEKTSVREALGRAYFRNRQFAEAATEFEAVVERQPVNDYAHFCLGRALSLTGRARSRPPPPGARVEPAARAPRLPPLPRPPSRRVLVHASCEGAGPAGQPGGGERRRRAAVADDRAGLLVLLGVARRRRRGRPATGSPTRCARCGSSRTPTGG